jgi:ABC-2 type transport system ATP-binding protein
MSSHILQEIQATVDRIIIIHNGEIVADGTSDELINDSKGLNQLEIELLNAKENDIQDMKAKVPSISVKSILSTDKDSKKIVLEYKNSSDPRKDVFEYAVKKKWVLIHMNSSKRNLEDIFRKLTKQGVKADA